MVLSHLFTILTSNQTYNLKYFQVQTKTNNCPKIMCNVHKFACRPEDSTVTTRSAVFVIKPFKGAAFVRLFKYGIIRFKITTECNNGIVFVHQTNFNSLVISRLKSMEIPDA